MDESGRCMKGTVIPNKSYGSPVDAPDWCPVAGQRESTVHSLDMGVLPTDRALAGSVRKKVIAAGMSCRRALFIRSPKLLPQAAEVSGR